MLHNECLETLKEVPEGSGLKIKEQKREKKMTLTPTLGRKMVEDYLD